MKIKGVFLVLSTVALTLTLSGLVFLQTELTSLQLRIANLQAAVSQNTQIRESILAMQKERFLNVNKRSYDTQFQPDSDFSISQLSSISFSNAVQKSEYDYSNAYYYRFGTNLGSVIDRENHFVLDQEDIIKDFRVELFSNKGYLKDAEIIIASINTSRGLITRFFIPTNIYPKTLFRDYTMICDYYDCANAFTNSPTPTIYSYNIFQNSKGTITLEIQTDRFNDPYEYELVVDNDGVVKVKLQNFL